MPRVEAARELLAPREDVWAFLAEPHHLADWWPGIAAVGGGPTMVFDEIDAGIGGETANAVGRTLRRLAERAQVVTITHLPQIASLADRHFSVEKVPGDPTHTRIDALGDDERRTELERMLGGAEFLASVR